MKRNTDSTVSGNSTDVQRRRFLGKVAGVGGLVAAQSLGFPGIQSGAMAATPKRGGRLRFGLASGSTTDSLDPATINSTFMSTINYGLRNSLTEVSPDGDLIPELCESWEASEGAQRWVFRLRRGVEFHNGKTFDARDAVASIEHHIKKGSKSPAEDFLKIVERVKADGDYTIICELNQGSADFPFLLSDYHVVMLPLLKDGLDATSGMGTGGYVLEEFTPGVRASLKRQGNYWKRDAAYLDSVEVLAISQSTARMNALATDEIDVMNRVPLDTASLLAQRPGLRIEETTGNQHLTFPMHTDKTPFNNNHVRLALKYAIDRQAILDNVISGHGYLGNDTPIGRGNRYHAAGIEQRQYDPDKAKYHLKKAGVGDLSVDLHTSNAPFQDAVDVSVLYQEQAKRAGLSINIVREPDDGYWSDVWLKVPFCAGYWGGRPTADWMFSAGYAAGASWNASNWDNERFNKLLKKARSELDTAKRADMYAEMQRIVRDDGGVVIPVFLNYVMSMSNKVQHGAMGANWDLDGLRAIERWWVS